MAFIDTTAAAEAQGDVHAMYERQQQAYGYVPNYARVFCYRPELMGLWADLQRGIRRHMDKKTYELATLAAAIALRSTYCALAHGSVLKAFYSEAEIVAIVAGNGVAEGVITTREQALMDFAQQVARDAGGVRQEDVDHLKSVGLTDAEVFDIAATASARAFFTKLVDGLGSDGDHDYPGLTHALKDALVVGRPIAVAETGCVVTDKAAMT